MIPLLGTGGDSEPIQLWGKKFCSVRFHFPAENAEFGGGHLYDPLEQRAKTAKRRAFMELNEWIQAVATVGKRSLSVSFNLQRFCEWRMTPLRSRRRETHNMLDLYRSQRP